jgi:signal transduction histidine kinase
VVSSISEFFSAGVLAPHAICLLWRKDLIAIHGFSDLLIALSYFAIPALIVKGTRLRPDLIDKRVATLFALFIMACGISHLGGLLTLWFPYYGWQALIKLMTAIISVITVYQLWRLWPDLMSLPSDDELTTVKTELIAQEKAVEIVEQSNNKLYEFAHLAAHDLRAPLSTLGMIVELMEPTDSEKETKQNIADMSTQVHRMQNLIDDLLHYATIGTSERQATEINISALINDVLDIIDVPESFVVRHECNQPHIVAVREELELILRNLISNAVRHHDQQTGNILIQIQCENQQLIIAVEDDGPGIPDDHKPKVLNRFYRINGNKGTGTGMGLAAVARAVESAGGSIAVTDSEHRGAAFNVTLPAPSQ